jgi:para-aminobenzoate synthetase component 1
VPGRDSFVLLEGEGWGESVLAFDPERHLVCGGERPPFEEVRELIREGHVAYGYFSYDVVRYLERLPAMAKDDLGLPVAQFILPGTLVRSGSDGVNILASEPDQVSKAMEVAYEVEGEAGLAEAKSRPRSTLGREEYAAVVERVREYVRAGDVFQVNISQRLAVPFEGDAVALYRRLRGINPSPFGGIVSFPGFTAVSCSPERLVNLRGGRATTRPIAGTYPRAEFDLGGEEEFLLDPKERAEHAMIVDLERNDLGRSCAYGSVAVDELMTTEAYSHVVHIVSEISGQLAAGRDGLDLLAGMFPGGTITGCPKVRCMEIIEEIEPVRRSLYTGSFGYVAPDEMDMNIAIRTILLKDGMAYAQAGGGIVADSVPEREHAESLAKAAALMQSLGAEL